ETKRQKDILKKLIPFQSYLSDAIATGSTIHALKDASERKAAVANCVTSDLICEFALGIDHKHGHILMPRISRQHELCESGLSRASLADNQTVIGLPLTATV